MYKYIYKYACRCRLDDSIFFGIRGSNHLYLYMYYVYCGSYFPSQAAACVLYLQLTSSSSCVCETSSNVPFCRRVLFNIYIMVKYSHINISCLMCALSYKRIARCSHLNVERIAITSYYILKYSTNPQEKVIHQRFSSRSIWRSIQRTHAREINNKYIIYIILYYI